MNENKMKTSRPHISNQDLNSIQKSVTDFIRCVPGLTVRCVHNARMNTGSAYRPDMVLDVESRLDGEKEADNRSSSHTWRLVVKAVRQPSPSVLETALVMLLRYIGSTERLPTEGSMTIVPVLFAPYLTPAAIDRCTDAGVNCIDAAGNGRIVLGGRAYIERIGRPDSTQRPKSTAPLFVPKAERVLRVLLNAAGALHRTWRVQPLAEEAGVSLGQVARVKSALRERGYITEDSAVRRYGGFHLTHPEDLLQEWAASVRLKTYRAGSDHTYNAVDTVQELKQTLCRKIPDCRDVIALSGLPAAERYAPYTVSPRFTAYVLEKEDVTLRRIEEALDLRPVQSGINVVLTVPRDEGVLYLPEDIKADFSNALDGLQAVSPIQAYLDLQRLGGRAEEGAQHLLETYLRPRWQRNGTNAS